MPQTYNVMVIPIGSINIRKLFLHFNLSSFIILNSTMKIKTYLKSCAEVKKISQDVQIRLIYVSILYTVLSLCIEHIEYSKSGFYAFDAMKRWCSMFSH